MWIYGILTGVLLGFIGLAVTLIFACLYKIVKSKFDNIIKIMIAFAVGSMLGDTFFHLIPHSLGIHNHEDHEEHDDHGEHAEEKEASNLSPKLVFISILSGIIIFYILEKALHFIGISHNHDTSDN